jgi:hypothetical protein
MLTTESLAPSRAGMREKCLQGLAPPIQPRRRDLGGLLSNIEV